MKKITVFLSATVLLVALFAVTAFKPLPPGPSASGQGTITIPGDITRHFAFHANTMPNGSVQGNGELTYTAGQLKIKFSIDCLVISGNQATMSGKIISWSDFPERAGWDCWFKVEDNGEGSNANPDKITRLLTNSALADCQANYGLALNLLEGGNIQVKP